MPDPATEHGAGSAVGPGVPFIGRDRELAALRAALAHVAGGTPVVALISGPFGIGKSRLAREALAVFAATGFRALRGRAHPFGSAYGPVTSALRPCLHGLEADRLAELVSDLPQLALLLGGLPVRAPPALGEPELERARLEDGLATLLERMARRQPLALMIDDLHRADRGTLSLLQVIASALSELPVVLLVTAATDAPADPPTDGATGDGAYDGADVTRIAMVESGWQLVDLELEPLEAQHAGALVRAMVPRDLPASLLQDVVARCAGRPLFLEALGDALADAASSEGPGQADPALPRGVRAQVRERVHSVGPDGRGVLELLAVAGGELDHVVLQRASGLSHGRFVHALGQLARRRMLTDRPGGNGNGYDLAHGVLRDALLEELSTVAQKRLHADLVRALERVRPADPTVAEHVLAAMPLLAPGDAIRLLTEGGERASRVGATGDAIRFWSGAATLARDERRGAALARALTALGRLLSESGTIEQARARWQEAMTAYADLGDPVGVARIRRELGLLAWSDGDPEQCAAHFAAAEESLAGLEQSPEHAELLYARLVTANRTGDSAAVMEVAGRLRRLADELGSPSLTARAHLAEGAVAFAQTDFVGSWETCLRALSAAEASRLPRLVIRARDQLAVTAAAQGDLAGTRRHSEASLEAAQRAGARTLGAWPRLRVAVVDLLAGQWDPALRGTTEVLALAQRGHQTRGLVSAEATHAWVLTHRGRLAEARECVDRAAEAARPALEADRNVFTMVRLADAELALVEGDPQHARRVAEPLGDLVGGWLPLLSAGVLGEALVACGDLVAARGLAARIRGVRSCSTALPEALGGWLEGLALTGDGHAGHGSAGVGHLLGSSAAAFDRLQLPFRAARARLAWAAATPERDAAVERGERALTVFESLGAPVQAQEARRLLRGLGVVPARGRPRGDPAGSLSPRELEVARLVATGLGNAAVAARLFISPRTVSTHLDRVYHRLGLSSRVALTRYLADSGLLEPDVPGQDGQQPLGRGIPGGDDLGPGGA